MPQRKILTSLVKLSYTIPSTGLDFQGSGGVSCRRLFPQHILQHFLKVFLAFHLQISSRLFTGVCDLHFLTAVVYEEIQQVLITSTVSKELTPEYLQYTLYAFSTTYWLKSAKNDCIIALDLGWFPSLIFNFLYTVHKTRHSCSNF